IRSRFTSKLCPTSSSVCSLPSPTPNRILMTFSSRGVSVLSTDSVCSLRFRLMTASAGEKTCRYSLHAHINLFSRRLTSQLLDQGARVSNQFVNRLDHVHRNANGSRLVGDGARDGLKNPPRPINRGPKPPAVPPLSGRHGQ